MSFKSAVKKTPQYAFTANGAKTHATSGSRVLDLFAIAGASRGKDLGPVIEAAIGDDLDRAIRILLWMRDCRGGAGERETFRKALVLLHEKGMYDTLMKITPLIPIIGRWDDLLVLKDTQIDPRPFIWDALKEGNGLCAKWMPRQGVYAEWLRGAQYTPKQWRKLLVGLSQTVEQLMCSKQWDKIEFKKVPSLASARYQNAFKKHCPHYEAYKAALTKGETTVHASVIFPHDVVKSYMQGDKVVSQAMWDVLPNYMPEGFSVLPVVDVSGSMTVSQGTSKVRPIDMALALGIYCSDKLKGPFKDLVCTFSATSDIYELKGDLGAKIGILQQMKWGMNTNLQKAFERILAVGVSQKVADADMPKMILVISDMEFDACSDGETNFSNIKAQYKQLGYTVPQLVFWNVNARAGNSPVRYHKTGTALISGYSPAILKAVLTGDKLDPMSVMDNAIMNERYKWQ